MTDWKVQADAIREEWPRDAEHLHRWVRQYTGVRIARNRVCRGHVPPFVAFAYQVLSRPRPDVSVWLAARGAGKSFLSAIDTHVISRWHPGHVTRILGGSLDQSKQIYNALQRIAVGFRGDSVLGNDNASISRLLAQSATYANGSQVSILACSEKSIRGDHVPSLKIDEVDEIDNDRRETAMGMNMTTEPTEDTEIGLSTLMTSTWHRAHGTMSNLMEKASRGEMTIHTWCVFEVLERCPESRSGRWVGGYAGFEKCPICPIMMWCHSDRFEHQMLPKAKRSGGHYRIRDLIQKARSVSAATMRSDYLCAGPKTDGLWFPSFDLDANVTEAAEYRPDAAVYWSIDTGVRTGGVLFQVQEMEDEEMTWTDINVFADYFSDGMGAGENARRQLELGQERCQGRRTRSFTDRSGAARNSIGPTVLAEYERAGLWPLESWPAYPGSVRDGLALIDAFLLSGEGRVGLRIHPRCIHLIRAFQMYERTKVNGQWTDNPRDPQHPAEDLMDALRGGLQALYPDGRRPEPKFHRVMPSRVF
jgi:hypothetical protein